jgi:hypothetical protein
MSQLGHTSAALALEVYAKKMDRQRDTGARMDALIRAADWGTNGHKSCGRAGGVADAEDERGRSAASF